MNGGSIAVDFRNPAVVRRAGLDALKKELGTVGAAYFLRQFGTGYGDYTCDRDQVFEDITLDELIKEVKELDASFNS